MKKVLAFILAVCMAVSVPLTEVRANEMDLVKEETDRTLKSVGETADGMEVQVEEIDKPMGSGYDLDRKSERATAPKEPENSIGKGIDISKWNWQSSNVDFEKLSKSVDFIIIRCGYGSDLKNQDDAYFKRSVEACEKYGIPYGVYLYSYATSVAKAQSEAQHTLRMIREANADPELPVFLDMEDAVQVKLSAAEKAAVAKEYCRIVEAAGYRTGIYANKNWWENYLTHSYFDSTIKWVAQYNTSCTYKKNYAIWQCSDVATVSGVAGVVDLNYMVDDIYDKPIEVQATGYSGTYDGKSHTVTVSGYKPGTEVLYSKDNKNWSTTKPTRKNAGTTTVYYQATNYKNQKITGSVKIQITARKISSATFSSISNKTHTGKSITPSILANYGGKTLKEGTDYTLTYGTNKSTGKATVVVTGKGNFKNQKTLLFYIVPKKVSEVKTSKGTKSRSAVLEWKKVTGSSGYRIAYSRKNEKKWNYVNVSKNTKTFLNLNVKTYDVKVRAYKTVDGVKKYGSYSAVKTMTAK